MCSLSGNITCKKEAQYADIQTGVSSIAKADVDNPIGISFTN